MPFQKDESGNQVWEPSDRQADFISLPDDIFEALYGGAAGGGKSEVLLYLPIVRQWHLHPKFHGGLIRTTFKKLDENLIPRSADIYPHFGAKYNETKKRWTFPSGARIQFIYLEEMKDAKDHDSTEFHFLGYDEITEQADKNIYEFMTSRVRKSDVNLPAIVRAATNPGNVGHGWVKKRFIDPCKDGYTIIFDKLSETRRIFIPSKATDNPHLMKADPGYVKRLNLLSDEADRKAKRDGDWDIFSGQVFGEFRKEKIESEPANALHYLNRFHLPNYLVNIASIDWGKAAQCHINWGALTPDKEIIIHTQYGRKGRSPEEWATDFCDINKEFNTKLVVIDPSSKQSREKESIYDQFVNKCSTIYGGHLPFQISLADNARVSGKNLVHDYLRWKPLDRIKVDKSKYDVAYANQIFRFQGEIELNKYLSQFEDIEESSKLPRLLIFKDSGRFVDADCVKLEDALLACVYDEKRVEDVAEFVGDDPYDSLRYLLKEADRYFNESKNLDEKSRRLQEIYDYLKATGDQHGFQTRMRFLDELEKGKPFAVSRASRQKGFKSNSPNRDMPKVSGVLGRNSVFAVGRRKRYR